MTVTAAKVRIQAVSLLIGESFLELWQTPQTHSSYVPKECAFFKWQQHEQVMNLEPTTTFGKYYHGARKLCMGVDSMTLLLTFSPTVQTSFATVPS